MGAIYFFEVKMSKYKTFWIDPSDELEKDDCEMDEVVYMAMKNHPKQGPLHWQSSLIKVIEIAALEACQKRLDEAVALLRETRTYFRVLDEKYGLAPSFKKQIDEFLKGLGKG